MAATKKGSTKKASTKKAASKKASKKASGLKIVGRKFCTGWQAWQNSMPPGPSTINVVGSCTFPSHGYKAKLTKAVLSGSSIFKDIHETRGSRDQGYYCFFHFFLHILRKSKGGCRLNA